MNVLLLRFSGPPRPGQHPLAVDPGADPEVPSVLAIFIKGASSSYYPAAAELESAARADRQLGRRAVLGRTPCCWPARRWAPSPSSALEAGTCISKSIVFLGPRPRSSPCALTRGVDVPGARGLMWNVQLSAYRADGAPQVPIASRPPAPARPCVLAHTGLKRHSLPPRKWARPAPRHPIRCPAGSVQLRTRAPGGKHAALATPRR